MKAECAKVAKRNELEHEVPAQQDGRVPRSVGDARARSMRSRIMKRSTLSRMHNGSARLPVHPFWQHMLLLASLVLLACDPPAIRKAKKSEWFLALPECSLSATSATKGWREVRAPRGELEFKIPPDFGETSIESIHGGAAWQRGNAKLSLRYGYYNLASFPSTPQRCRALINDQPVVVFTFAGRQGTSSAAWFVASGAGQKFPYDIVLGFSSTLPSDANIFATILTSASR